jgi:RNA polymerase sigma-70 factor (ECF subfamily)
MRGDGVYMTRECLNELVEAYRSMVYRLAFSCLGNSFDADDISQEVFLRMYGYKKQFADEEHKKAFLIRITVNLCKNLQKTAWMRKRVELDENIPADNHSYESESLLQSYVLKLKPNYRAVIYLFYYEGYCVAEIAKILKISETSVTTRLSRARNQLKAQLLIDKEVAHYD